MSQLKRLGNVVYYDNEWQYPAITEKHAFLQMRKLSFSLISDYVYFAFPWATLIDRKAKQKTEASSLQDIALQVKELIYPHEKLITVCQHVQLLMFPKLIEKIGLKHIFWSHAASKNINTGIGETIFHPFPLYPVNYEHKSAKNKKFLYSFIGAKNNQWYLSDVRNKIEKYLPHVYNSKIVLREEWHYRDIVYIQQIDSLPSRKCKDKHESESSEYKEILNQSIFSLCPSGTGPNSIRLWESLGAGAIPVILADTYLPPGPLSLWEEAAVFCPETVEAVAALPAKLEAMAKDSALLEKKRRAMKCLWLKYGPDCFVYDVLKFLMENDAPVAAQPVVLGRSLNSVADSLARIAEDVLSSRLSPREVAPLVWRGLYTRARTSPEALRTLLATHPEIVQAATVSYSFLPANTRDFSRHAALRSIPELNKLLSIAS